MSPERPEQDDFLEDEEQEEYEGQRSIFATGWFRAVLVLLVLAVIAVIAVPLIGGWFEPTPPPKVTTTRPSEPSPPPAPSPPSPAPTSPPAQMPSTSAPPMTSPSMGTPPASTTPPATTPPTAAMPTPAPPATAPAPIPAPARPEIPAASTPSKAPEKAKAPERTAAAPGKSAAKAPAVGSGNYWVQVGAFKESRNAEGLAKTLRSEGFGVQIARVTRDQPLHVVRVGGYPDRSKAAAAREELQGKGHTGFVTSGPAK